MKNRFLIPIFILIICTELANAEGLSGSLSLSPLPAIAPAHDGISEITAIGIGLDAVSAEKQALIAAVQQAVGSFLDTKSITENEEVIKDRVLSLSNGFVSKYDVISGPKQRDDKLFEVTIKAQVQGSQVVAKLKEVNLIKGEVAGKDLYAQNMTQMLSAEDAIKMLNEKLPELIVNCIKMEFVDKDGNPQPNSNPVEQVRDDQTQKVKCTWYVKISVDKAFYVANIYPMFKRCLDAIFTGASEDMELNNIDASEMMKSRDSYDITKIISEESLAMRTLGEYKSRSEPHGRKDFFLIKSATRDGVRCIGTLYSGKEYVLKGKSDPQYLSENIRLADQKIKYRNGIITDPYDRLYSSIELKILSKSDNLIAFGQAKVSDSFNPTRQILGPFASYQLHDDGMYLSICFDDSEIARITVDLAINDLKDVGKIDVSLHPRKYSLQVTPANFKK